MHRDPQLAGSGAGFQVVTNSFAAGLVARLVVLLMVTSPGQTCHGNIFGFSVTESFQARNPFAPIANPPFTRVRSTVSQSVDHLTRIERSSSLPLNNVAVGRILYQQCLGDSMPLRPFQ